MTMNAIISSEILFSKNPKTDNHLFSEVYEADIEQDDYGDNGETHANNDNWYTVT